MPVAASLTPAELTAEPGTSAAFTLEVANTGPTAATVRFDVVGEAAAWAMVVPPELTVAAGAAGRARVMVRVPRSPHRRPGPAPLGVRVAGADPAEVHGVVTVAPFTELRASLSPRASRARRTSVHTLHVENLGNEAVAATIEPGPADPALTVELDRLEVTVGAGELAAIPVRLRAGRPRLLGRPKSRTFRLAVRGGPQGEAVTTDGILVQERTRWPLSVAAAGVVGLVGLAMAAGSGTDGASRPSPAPATTVVAAAAGPAAACPPADPASAPGELVVENFLFCPATVTVTRGTELRWTNRDGAPHTVSADSDLFDTGNFGRGEARGIRFDTPGTHTYFCRVHPFMRGTVVVT